MEQDQRHDAAQEARQKGQTAPVRSVGRKGGGEITSLFRNAVEAALAEKGLSATTAATRAGLPRDTIRVLMRGAAPSLDRAELICRTLGIEWRLGDPAGPKAARPAETTLPIRRIERRNSRWVGRWSGEEAPAPPELEDPRAFYVVAPNDRMQPAGIRKGDYALVSPCAPMEPGALGWLQGGNGIEEHLLWVIRIVRAGFETIEWIQDVSGAWTPSAAMLPATDRGRIIAVYAGRPDTREMPETRATLSEATRP